MEIPATVSGYYHKTATSLLALTFLVAGMALATYLGAF